MNIDYIVQAMDSAYEDYVQDRWERECADHAQEKDMASHLKDLERDYFEQFAGDEYEYDMSDISF